jgi:predicted membrane protein
MESQDQNNPVPPRHNSRIMAGLFVILIGAAFLLREMSFPFFPHWLFTWPMILIAVGIYTGLKHDFRGAGWLIMLVIGGIFLTDEANFGFDMHRFLVPAIIIAVGFMIIVRPGRRWISQDSSDWHFGRGRRSDWYRGNNSFGSGPVPPPGPQQPGPGEPSREGAQQQYAGSGEDTLHSTSIFGGIKKIIFSKNFKGGEINCFLGGAEIDLTQADIQGTVVLDVSCFLGGAKLIIPANWTLKSEMSAVFGGIEDKRKIQNVLQDPNKVLLIRGTCFMGGFELRSY